jgi:hypothetical protein
VHAVVAEGDLWTISVCPMRNIAVARLENFDRSVSTLDNSRLE